jgi:UDP-GlcNAc:undecaprenyl-phosphate/decaprenyl-phosphate GlcNAc-1-phosphate transferase
MIAAVLGILILACVVGVPMAMIARGLGRRWQAMDGAGVVGQVKEASRRVPNTGGIGIAAVVLGGLACSLLIHVEAFARHVTAWIPEAAEHLERWQSQGSSVLWLMGCVLVLHIMGVIDDRKPLSAMPKLLVMLGVSCAFVLGTDTRLLTLLDGHAGGAWLSVAITVLWLVVVTNALNFIDNMDGLSGGIGAIAGACFLATALIHKQWFVGAALALLVGALLGFLVFNYPWKRPSKWRGASMFMGDGGSLIVGFMLAAMSVRLTYAGIGSGNEGDNLGAWYGVLTPLVVLSVVLYDMTAVTAIRLWQGKSPFVGDLQHLSHRLHFRGLSKQETVLVIHGLCIMTGLGGVMLASLKPWQAVIVGVQTLLAVVVFAMWEYRASHATREGARKGEGSNL